MSEVYTKMRIALIPDSYEDWDSFLNGALEDYLDHPGLEDTDRVELCSYQDWTGQCNITYIPVLSGVGYSDLGINYLEPEHLDELKSALNMATNSGAFEEYVSLNGLGRFFPEIKIKIVSLSSE